MSQSTIVGQIPTSDTDLLELLDLCLRVVGNQKVSPIYRCLYISLVNLYPDLLLGDDVPVSIWKVRERTGWASEASATKFFQDMVTIGAFSYEPGRYNRDDEKREGLVRANLELFPYPELFDTRSTENRKKARDAEKERRENIRALILACEECGSDQIKYTLLPTCKSCGHKHTPIKDVPAGDITLKDSDADEDNLPGGLDGFNEPAAPAPSFLDIPHTEKYARSCRAWSAHRHKWKHTISGLHCPICEPAFAI